MDKNKSFIKNNAANYFHNYFIIISRLFLNVKLFFHYFMKILYILCDVQ